MVKRSAPCFPEGSVLIWILALSGCLLLACIAKRYWYGRAAMAEELKDPVAQKVVQLYKLKGWDYATASNVASGTGMPYTVVVDSLQKNVHTFRESVLPDKDGEKLYYVNTHGFVSGMRDYWKAFGQLNNDKKS